MRHMRFRHCWLVLLAVALVGSVFSSQPAKAADADKYQTLLKDAKPVTGLIKMHRKDGKLYAELTSSQLNKDFIILISIARGIGEGSLLGGMTWGFGDDWIWQFRKVEDNIHIVRRNVRFKADKGSPEEKAVRLAYTDSVLYSLPIAATGPSGGMLIDMTSVFMSDLPQISRVLPGFVFSSSKSTWDQVKGFADNVELEVAATYASSGSARLDTVPDSRGVTINVHYSISMLPSTGYQSRMADDRVGYFLTVIKDYSKKGDEDRFIRYINRWDLQKADASADLSPPKKPIIFWLEKTVPFKYRSTIREGILEWNKAFEKAGFVDAIEVRQQPDNADWDPEDINYNTFRWITSSAGFAMGPSRVNPTTGQILDADIIFDADFVQFWKAEYETFTPESVAAMTGGPLDLESYRKMQQLQPPHAMHGRQCNCGAHHEFGRQLAFGSTVLAAAAPDKPSGEDLEKLIKQGLKEVVMHEVGHTLGLRHNFKASSYLTMEEMNDVEKTSKVGLTASVMDYAPVNISPQGKKQGDYYSTTIGPYDTWAIEYGYKPHSGGTDGEVKELQKVAARSGEKGLAYSTDEDTRGIDSDPLSNRFDLGADPIEYAARRAELVSQLWPGLVDRVTKDGEGYQKARQAFGILLGNHGSGTFFAARHIGGLYVNRSHKGDKNGPAPFVVVPAEVQRKAMALVEKQMFSDKPFDFPPELYNHLAASRWNHWGTFQRTRLDYPVHQVISVWQDRVLDYLFSSLTLTRLHDSELKIPADEDAFTAAELLDRLTNSIFAEVDNLEPGKEFTTRKPAIGSLRRNLQRSYLSKLSQLAMGGTGSPEDCQTIAFMELQELQEKIEKNLKQKNLKLDAYSKAHLTETASRIEKVLDAHFELARP